jgi:hypothetical protein
MTSAGTSRLDVVMYVTCDGPSSVAATLARPTSDRPAPRCRTGYDHSRYQRTSMTNASPENGLTNTITRLFGCETCELSPSTVPTVDSLHRARSRK